MDGVEAKKMMRSNTASATLVRNLTPLPKDIQALLLKYVGTFRKYNQLRNVFLEFDGCLDCVSRRFRLFRPFAGPQFYELSDATKNTIVFVDDFLCYNPFHIWSDDEPTLSVYDTDEVVRMSSPRGDGGVTMGEIVDFILQCELERRPRTMWFGGPDHDHIHFENFMPEDGLGGAEDTVWSVFWVS